jgi:hypothetical protein
MTEPKQRTSMDVRKRWLGSDGRSYSTRAEALQATPDPALQSDAAGEARKDTPTLRLFHLVSAGAHLTSPRSALIAAFDPESALADWMSITPGDGGLPGEGDIAVYDYASRVPGRIWLEHERYCVARFNKNDRERIAHENIDGRL